ncbi:MAG: tRNA pseudouridine synthase A, partial [Terracidiphilus sp.]
SGRTDAGVHALGQVASFALRAAIPPENLERALNRILPPSIRICEARTAPGGFHARHSAKAKTYEYRVFRGGICPPFLARYVHPCAWPMEFAALEESARMFVGEHDFLSFAASDPDLALRGLDGDPEPGPGTHTEIEPAGAATHASTRTIFASSWEQRRSGDGEIWAYRVRGNGFLHHMVRNLVGTMLDVGRGRLKIEEIGKILEARARPAAGPTAPARGLFLHSVEYDEGLN